MSTYWINVPSGQTVHLRSEAETNTSNVITELPRGYPVTRVFSLDPFKYVSVWDCIDTIEGYVHQNYLTGVPSTCKPRSDWKPFTLHRVIVPKMPSTASS